MKTLSMAVVAVVLVGCAGVPATTVARAQMVFQTRAFHVEVVGHVPPMILIPGLASGGEVWQGTVDHFKDRYTCHVLTLAGFAGQASLDGALLPAVHRELER